MKSKLALLLPIRCILFILIFLCIHLITNKEYNELTNCWSIVCSIVNILCIIYIKKKNPVPIMIAHALIDKLKPHTW